MFKKELIVHVIRIGQPAYILKPRSLIDAVCNDDGSIKFPFDAFNCHPSRCSIDAEIDRRDRELMTAESGEFTVVETPAGTALVVISLILSVASAIYAYTQSSNIPTAEDLGASSNNSLSARTNRERPLKRIEDIAGKVNSVPSLIQLPYRKWVDNVEVEYSYMSVSVGSGIPSSVRDGDTPIEIMDGSGAQFYAPYTSPNNTLTPEYTFGDSFQERVQIVRRSNEVDGGRVLETISDLSLLFQDGYVSASTATGAEAGLLTRPPGFGYKFTDYFEVGDEIDLDLRVIDSVTELDYLLSGQYKIDAIADDTVELVSVTGGGAETVNVNWGLINDLSRNTLDGSMSPSDTDITYAGPFLLVGSLNGFYINLAASGLISDAGGIISIQYAIQYAQADDSGSIIGDWSVGILKTITGQTRDKIGSTTEVAVPFLGNILVRARRVTDRIEGAQLQDLTIDALYSTKSIGDIDFGNVTTVQTRVLQSQRASQIKERKLNVDWQRKLPIISDSGVAGGLAVTSRFVDYYVYAALSDKIGRRAQWELNNADIAAKYNEIVDYFGDSRAAEFNYTFDSDQVSFQDTCEIISKAVFCQSIRRRGVITVDFERPESPSTIFCHRTKIPNQQTITRSFKSDSINDGVEFTYIDPETNEQAIISIPSTGAITPRKIESLGVRNYEQAYWLAWRAFNKLKYQRLTLNDTFTAEGQLLSTGDVVGVTDDTKASPENGEIVFISGLVLTLSQPVTFTDGEAHSITLRKRDGSIQGIACSNPNASNTTINVLLASLPIEDVYTGDAEERTKFTFSTDDRAGAEYYIITDVDRSNPEAVSVTGINYDGRYYGNDSDVVNWIDGEPWIDEELWID